MDLARSHIELSSVTDLGVATSYGMEAQSILEYERLEKYYWWFVGRRFIIERVLVRYFSDVNFNILDWGCGPGGNFRFLSRYGHVLGADASDEALSACKEKGIQTVVKASKLSDLRIDVKFDLITNFDVLEHIQEDKKFLFDLNKFLVPGGFVLVTVPAYQFLWTGLDDVLGHKRRYTRGEICKKFEACGFKIIKASYFIFFLSPAFIAFRMLQKLKKVKTASLGESVINFPKLINRIFTRLLFLEAIILPYLSFPFGTSIIILARRDN